MCAIPSVSQGLFTRTQGTVLASVELQARHCLSSPLRRAHSKTHALVCSAGHKRTHSQQRSRLQTGPELQHL